MEFRRPGRNVWTIFAICVVFSLMSNFWISYELRKLENSSAISNLPVEENAEQLEPPEVHGIVAIDPQTDPLAPVNQGVKPAPKTEQVLTSSQDVQPIYEPPMNETVLIQ